MHSSKLGFQGLLWPDLKVLSIHSLDISYLDALMIYSVPRIFPPRCQMSVVLILVIFYDSSNVKPLQNLPVTFLARYNFSVVPYLYFLNDRNHGQLATKMFTCVSSLLYRFNPLETNYVSLQFLTNCYVYKRCLINVC